MRVGPRMPTVPSVVPSAITGASTTEHAASGSTPCSAPIATDNPRFFEGVLDVIAKVRARRVTRNLGFLPRGQRGVGGGKKFGALGFQSRQFGRDIDLVALGGRSKLGNTPVELGDGLLEVEVGLHRQAASRAGRRAQAGDARSPTPPSAPNPRECKSASSRCRHDRAVSATHAGPPRPRGGGSRTHGEAHEG